MPKNPSGGFNRFTTATDQLGDLTVVNPDGSLVGTGTTATPSVVRVEDGGSTLLATIAQQHLGDGLTQPSTGGALLTSGPAQVTDLIGTSSRLREAGADQQPALGIQSGIASFMQEFLATSTTTVAVAAGPVNATSVATSTGVTINVANTNGFKVGGKINFEPGAANYESAYIKSVVANTSVTVVFGSAGALFTHTQPYTVQTFLANQERDYSGEGPIAAGTGAAIATEFESNSGGPPLSTGLASGYTLDADRNFQGKNTAQMGITATTAGASMVVFTNNPWTSGLIVGQPLLLSVGANGAAVEEVIVSKNNLPAVGAGPVTVNLASPVVNAGSTFATFDVFGLVGPGSGQTTVFGVEDNLEYVFDVNATDPKRPIAPMISATGDALPAKNIPAESEVLWNGTGFDRARVATGDALPVTGIPGEAEMLWNGTGFDRARVSTGDGLAQTGIPIENPGLLNAAGTYDRGRGLLGAESVSNLTKQTNETSVALAANGVFNGAPQDTGNNVAGAPGWSKFRAMSYSDQAGTLNIQQSRDGVTWRTTISQATVAATGVIVESIITRRYVRASYTNGATIQATFELDSCLVAV